jgi:hypothetical protein
MSSITYYNPNDEFCLEVRQWFLDNPQDDSDAESIGDSSGAMNSFYGKTHSPETKNLLSYLTKNRMTEETRKKLSEVGKGRKFTSETRKKMSEASKGKPKSEQMRKRLSETKTGTTRPPFSEEWLNNLSEARKGEKNGFYGKKHTPETKKKISEARKRQTGVKRGPYKKRNTI